MLTVLNGHSFALTITGNGHTFTLAPGEQSSPVAITRYSHGNDIVEARLVQEPTGGMGDADGDFPTPGQLPDYRRGKQGPVRARHARHRRQGHAGLTASHMQAVCLRRYAYMHENNHQSA